ncbi:GIY-YIG nuclease family protein [Maribellus comscasis]|uniref:GIY-YIG nuclease family protein n=1 Tax=Maribellus comscasis TaxID=2681766 RepID=A0A6I6JX75_9BACT|nr:GIY-YIG nuclease family protein [Maribellus comscasis]QGY45718.1 GIY-YIG nuclease family protein [Maribellus comscasis]
MNSKKELKKAYKEMKFQIGVFQIRNTLNGKIFVGSSTDLNAIRNRIRTELKFGSYPNAGLQKDWINDGEENFVFEVLSELKQGDGDKKMNIRKELKQLERMFIEELQPFENRGYNLK